MALPLQQLNAILLAMLQFKSKARKDCRSFTSPFQRATLCLLLDKLLGGLAAGIAITALSLVAAIIACRESVAVVGTKGGRRSGGTGGQQQQETIVPIKSQWRESTSLVESSVSQATVPMQPKMNFVGGATIKPVHLMQATD